MSKKNDSLVERLEQQIRTLKAENRLLLRRIKRLSRGYKRYIDEKPLAEPTPNKPCPHCAKGTLTDRSVLNRSWAECEICDYKSKVIINE